MQFEKAVNTASKYILHALKYIVFVTNSINIIGFFHHLTHFRNKYTSKWLYNKVYIFPLCE
jgi:hypothetical protein